MRTIEAPSTPLAGPARDLCGEVRFRDKALRDYDGDLTVEAFLDELIAKEQFTDAIRILAHALPKPQAVWWFCLCLWNVYRRQDSAEISASLNAALAWLAEPSEENRRFAEIPGREGGLSEPAGCLAMAVFWSGGSMAPAYLATVPPSPELTARVVAGGIVLTSVRDAKAKVRRRRRREFLAIGKQIASGQLAWQKPVSKPVEDIAAESLAVGMALEEAATVETVAVLSAHETIVMPSPELVSLESTVGA